MSNDPFKTFLSEILASVTNKDWVDGLLQVQPDFISPTGLLRMSSGVHGMSGGVCRMSDTILWLILMILGIRAFIWSRSGTLTSSIRVWSDSGETKDCRLNKTKSPGRLPQTSSDLSKIKNFTKISPVGLIWSPIGLWPDSSRLKQN